MKIIGILGRRGKVSEVQKKIFSSFFWTTISSVISQLIGIINAIIIAQYLGLNLFGQYTIILNTVVTLGIFASLGLAITAAKFGAKYSKRKERLEKFIASCYQWAFLASLLLIVVLIFVNFSHGGLLSQKISKESFLVAILFIIPITLTSIQNNLITAFNGFRAIALMNLLRAIITIIATYFLIRMWGVNGAILVSLLTYIVQFIFFEIYLQRFYALQELNPNKYLFKVSNLFERINFKILRQFSIPSLLQNLLVVPVIWILNIWLIKKNDGLENTGIFNAIFQWRNSLLFIPSILGQTLVPILSKLNNKRSLKSVIETNVKALALLYIIPIIILLITRNYLLDLYKINNAFAVDFFTIILFSVYFQVITIPFGQFLTLTNKIWVGFTLNLIWVVQLFVLIFFFHASGMNDLLAIGYSFLISYLTHLIISFFYFKRKTYAI